MMRAPAVDPEKLRLIAQFERKLRYFQRVPRWRREAELADTGEQTCHAMLDELGVPGHAKPKRLTEGTIELMTMDEFFAELEKR